MFGCRLLFSSWRLSSSNGRFSLPNWRLHASFSFEAFDNFFKGESRFFKIDFEFKSILIGKLNLLFESVKSLLFELFDIGGRIDVDCADLKVLIALSFVELEREEDFSIFIEVGKVEVELAASEGHDVGAVSIDKVGIGRYFVFIKFLHS